MLVLITTQRLALNANGRGIDLTTDQVSRVSTGECNPAAVCHVTNRLRIRINTLRFYDQNKTQNWLVQSGSPQWMVVFIVYL